MCVQAVKVADLQYLRKAIGDAVKNQRQLRMHGDFKFCVGGREWPILYVPAHVNIFY